jgi:hypothetical protein
MVIRIDNRYSYLIEAQIGNDRDMGVRIFQYIIEEGRRSAVKEGRTVVVRLPAARVIYWETGPRTPDKEIVCFEFPDGVRHNLEVLSFKFPEYSIGELEERQLGLLLPFCVLKLRGEVRRARSGEERRGLAARMRGLLRELAGAAARSGERGWLEPGDLDNVMHLTKRLHRELYSQYTEFGEEERMWEDIQVIDFDALRREKAELEREIAAAEREKVEAEQKARKAAMLLRDMGVPENQLAALGLV